MKNVAYSIFIVGENRGKGVYRVLSKKRKNVYYFNSEEECLKSLKSDSRIIIIEDSPKSMLLLEELRKFPVIHIIYLSNLKGFPHMINAIRRGVCDYIIKDSYLYYSILKSINKAERSNEAIELSGQEYFNTCSLIESFPIRFKIARWLGYVK